MPLAAVVVSTAIAFAAELGEAAVAAGLGDAGAEEVTAAAFAGETAGEPAGAALGAGDACGVVGPVGVGLALAGAFSSSTGALFPMFAKSGPNLILPSKTGRSKR